jgi:hypothetical protein
VFPAPHAENTLFGGQGQYEHWIDSVSRLVSFRFGFGASTGENVCSVHTNRHTRRAGAMPAFGMQMQCGGKKCLRGRIVLVFVRILWLQNIRDKSGAGELGICAFTAVCDQTGRGTGDAYSHAAAWFADFGPSPRVSKSYS